MLPLSFLFLFFNKLTRPCSKLDFPPSVRSCFQLSYPQHPQSVNCHYRQWSASGPAAYGNYSVGLNMLHSAAFFALYHIVFFLQVNKSSTNKSDYGNLKLPQNFGSTFRPNNSWLNKHRNVRFSVPFYVKCTLRMHGCLVMNPGSLFLSSDSYEEVKDVCVAVNFSFASLCYRVRLRLLPLSGGLC